MVIQSENKRLTSGDEEIGSTTQLTAYKRNFGDHMVFWFREDGEPRCSLGPNRETFYWAMALLVAWNIGFNIWLLCTQTLSYFLSHAVFGSATILTYAAVGLKNQGIASKDQIQSDQTLLVDTRFCHLCQVLRANGTMHCPTCGVCIEELDHHCPWTGKCVGKGNRMEFYAFIASFVVYFGFNFMNMSSLAQKL